MEFEPLSLSLSFHLSLYLCVCLSVSLSHSHLLHGDWWLNLCCQSLKGLGCLKCYYLLVSFILHVAFSVINDCISFSPHTHLQLVHLRPACLLRSTHTLGGREAIIIEYPGKGPAFLLGLISVFDLLEGELLNSSPLIRLRAGSMPTQGTGVCKVGAGKNVANGNQCFLRHQNPAHLGFISEVHSYKKDAGFRGWKSEPWIPVHFLLVLMPLLFLYFFELQFLCLCNGENIDLITLKRGRGSTLRNCSYVSWRMYQIIILTIVVFLSCPSAIRKPYNILQI